MKAESRSSSPSNAISVVITGSECTGKSTLARDLAAHYRAEVVPEFIRQFIDTVGGKPQFADHGPIARGQRGLEDEFRSRATGLLFHDTDLVSTVVYCRHYFGRCPEWIEGAAADRLAPLYLLCDIDVPWIPDGLRDRGDRREEMHALFVTALDQAGANWALVRGDPATRVRESRRHVDLLLS